MVHEEPRHANRHVLVCQAIMVFVGVRWGPPKTVTARLLNMNVIISNDFTVC